MTRGTGLGRPRSGVVPPATHVEGISWRQGQIYFPDSHQRVDRLRGKRRRHIHQHRVDFVPRWFKAYITGWPVAAVLAFLAVPYVRRATKVIVRLIED